MTIPNHQAPNQRLKRCLQVTLSGLLLNTVLAGTKMFAGIVGHSHALVADAVESLSDIFSSIVVWRAIVVAAQPADEDHPYGHGKAEPIAAGLVSCMLLAAAVWIGVTAMQEVRQPHQAPAPFTLAVLFVVIIIKETLFRFVLRESDAAGSTAMHTDAWHHRSDAITSAAAAVGIGVALIGGKGYEAADDYAALVAALVIAWNGWRLLRQALGELMDQSPNPNIVDSVRRLAQETSGVECIEKCFVRKMGYAYYVDLHAQVDPEMSVRRSHEIAHAIKDNVRAGIPTVYDVLVHIEPCLPPYRPSRPEDGRG
ncbi:MAG: cation diffusion facilitator family transporter [Verrucomicrobiota bacterium]